MTGKPLRPVTAKCVTCARRVTPGRADQHYCTAACRQRAHRARSQVADLDRQIQAARTDYWTLIREKEMAHGAERSHVVTAEAQFIESDGNVWMHGGHKRRCMRRHAARSRLTRSVGPTDPLPCDCGGGSVSPSVLAGRPIT